MARNGTRELLLGVDFGTSYSSAGVLVDGRAQLVMDQGESAMPSVIHLPRSGEPLIGNEAMMRLMNDPMGTIQSIKRILGAPHESKAVRRLDASVGYRLKRGPEGRVILSIRDTDYACEQIVAMILARLRDLAEQRFAGRCERIVATVPAAASEEFRDALRRAARLAHLEVVEMVAEPVAGALAMGIHGDPVARRFLVCDFGGGTFDATLVEQDGLAFEPVAYAGDPFLGGDDFDEELANAVAGVVYKKSSYDMLRDAVRRQLLLFRCESVKRMLSSRDEAPLRMKDAYNFDGETKNINAIIERSWIEPRWKPLAERSMQVVGRMLGASGWDASHVDQVVLIGGATMMPVFRSAVAQAFPGVDMISTDYANLAVALGATLRTAVHLGLADRTPVIRQAQPITAAAS